MLKILHEQLIDTEGNQEVAEAKDGKYHPVCVDNQYP